MDCSFHNNRIIFAFATVIILQANFTKVFAKSEQPLDGQLMESLFKEYDARAIPRVKDLPLEIKVGFTLVQLHSLDEKNQMLTSSGWFQMEWRDYRLAWNQSDFKYDHIVIPSRDLWLPDIGFLNSATIYHRSMIKNEFRCVLYSDGSVLWVPGGTYYTTCELDISKFPFDSQSCNFHLTNWAYNLEEMNLTMSSNEIGMASYKRSAEWEITKTYVNRTEVVYECCGNIAYPSLFFHIEIERKSLYYVVNILIPCIILSIMATFTFCVPPSSGEKVSLGITLLLSFTVFQLIVAESIPRRSDSVPIISLYISTIILTVTASVICAILVTRIHYAGPVPIPDRMRWFTFDFLAKAVCRWDLSKEFGTTSWRRGSAFPLKKHSSSERKKSNFCLSHAVNETTKLMTKVTDTDSAVDPSHSLLQKTNNHVEHMMDYLKEYGKRKLEEETAELLSAQWRAAALVYDKFFFLFFIGVTIMITSINLAPSCYP